MDEEIENLEKEKAKIKKIKVGAMDDLLTGRVRLIQEVSMSVDKEKKLQKRVLKILKDELGYRLSLIHI